MKPAHFVVVACLFLSVLATAAEPKKKAPPKKAPPKKAAPAKVVVDTKAVALIKPFDKDGNYALSDDEFKAMQAAYGAAPNGPLKELDRGQDGTLDYVDQIGIGNKLGAAKMVANPKAPPPKAAKPKAAKPKAPAQPKK